MNKFKDILNTSIFTTKYVIQDNSPILHVYHYDDGNWQFSGSEKNLKDEDYRIISLKEILKIDKSLNELEDLPLGFEAIRTKVDQPWNKIAFN
jgi:hypothetical protein